MEECSVAKNKKNRKRNILFIGIGLFIIIFITVVFIAFQLYNKELIYKDSVSIMIGEELPVINDYVDNEELRRLENYQEIRHLLAYLEKSVSLLKN